jgi:hypothetical protein
MHACVPWMKCFVYVPRRAVAVMNSWAALNAGGGGGGGGGAGADQRGRIVGAE